MALVPSPHMLTITLNFTLGTGWRWGAAFLAAVCDLKVQARHVCTRIEPRTSWVRSGEGEDERVSQKRHPSDVRHARRVQSRVPGIDRVAEDGWM